MDNSENPRQEAPAKGSDQATPVESDKPVQTVDDGSGETQGTAETAKRAQGWRFIKSLTSGLKFFEERWRVIWPVPARYYGKAKKALNYSYALSWHRYTWIKYRINLWNSQNGRYLAGFAAILIIGSGFYLYPFFRSLLSPYLTNAQRLADIKAMLLALGGALIGAAAIAFSLIMFALQVNVDRMPHGLFRKLNEDKRLIGAFCAVFILALLILCTSLVPDTSHLAAAILIATHSTFFLFVILLYAYRRAIALISPAEQLKIIVDDATVALKLWGKRATRATPLFIQHEDPVTTVPTEFDSSHDLPRIAYFQFNPHWTTEAVKAVHYAISFARRYAERGDYEVSVIALNAIVIINEAYIQAKGKTFFSGNAFLSTGLETDGFINNTLEHLRQNIQVGISRHDEQQLEQTLRALCGLVKLYARIDYSNAFLDKPHAQLAALYLSEGVQSVMPHNMTEVMMEGVRLIGGAAEALLKYAKPMDITSLAEKLAIIACTFAAPNDSRPVTSVAVEQLAKLTAHLLQTKSKDISFAVKQVKNNLNTLSTFVLDVVPDNFPASVHSSTLAAYYSGTRDQTFLGFLTALTNAIVARPAEDQDAKNTLANIEEWSDQLDSTAKELLLKAVERRSHFTFDIIAWIGYVTKVLIVLSKAPTCDDDTKTNLRKNARWLIYVLSFIPDDAEAIAHVENYCVSETIFQAALDAYSTGDCEFAADIGKLLFDWGFKAGQYRARRLILIDWLYGLATIALLPNSWLSPLSLKEQFRKYLTQPHAPNPGILKSTADYIRREMLTFRRSFDSDSFSCIRRKMREVDQGQLRRLLTDLANVLSPSSADNVADQR